MRTASSTCLQAQLTKRQTAKHLTVEIPHSESHESKCCRTHINEIGAKTNLRSKHKQRLFQESRAHFSRFCIWFYTQSTVANAAYPGPKKGVFRIGLMNSHECNIITSRMLNVPKNHQSAGNATFLVNMWVNFVVERSWFGVAPTYISMLFACFLSLEVPKPVLKESISGFICKLISGETRRHQFMVFAWAIIFSWSRGNTCLRLSHVLVSQISRHIISVIPHNRLYTTRDLVTHMRHWSVDYMLRMYSEKLCNLHISISLIK